MRVVIVGHSPGKVSAEKSITLRRVKNWLNANEVYVYGWYNLVDYHAPSLKLREATLNPDAIKEFNVVLSLGNLASEWLRRNNIEHLRLPHPSGLNRYWNNPEAESNVIKLIEKYLKHYKNSQYNIH